jgi:hypothetical protein
MSATGVMSDLEVVIAVVLSPTAARGIWAWPTWPSATTIPRLMRRLAHENSM